jgi:hypothetical protein
MYDSLELDEAGLLLKLLPYMSWETNLLVGDGKVGVKGAPLRWSDIDKIIKCSKPKRIKIVRALEQKGIIGYQEADGKKIGIVVNPTYAINGKKPAMELLQTFSLSAIVTQDDE